MNGNKWNRRELIQAGVVLSALPQIALSSEKNKTLTRKMLTKPIPRSGELLPVVGLGTYNVFDVENKQICFAELKEGI